MKNRPTRDVKTHRSYFIEGAEQLIPESMHLFKGESTGNYQFADMCPMIQLRDPNQMIWIDGRQPLNKMLP